MFQKSRIFLVVAVLLMIVSVTGAQTDANILQVATSAPPEFQNIYFRNNNNKPLYAAVFETLLRTDETGTTQPILAESWAWSDDLTTLTFALRNGVAFSSGNPLTSAAVQANIERALEDDVVSQLKGPFGRIESMETPDELTLVLNLTTADLGFLDSFEGFNIADPAFFEQQGTVAGHVGTGPFVLTDFVPEDRVTLVANETYWQEGLPLLDGIEIVVVPDQDALVLNLESGAVDMIVSPTVRDMDRLNQDAGYQVTITPNLAEKIYVGANVADPLLSDVRVRQALNYAIPRERYSQVVNLGLTDPLGVPWATVSPAFDAEQDARYRLDLDRARELLAEVGVEEGTPIVLAYGSQKEGSEEFVVIYEEALRQLGFEVEVRAFDNAQFSEKLGNATWEQLWVGLHGNTHMFPANLLTQNRPYLAEGNGSNYTNEQYTELIAASQVEADDAARSALFSDITDIILEDSFVMPFATKPIGWAMTNDVEGFTVNKFDWVIYTNMAFSG